MGSWHWTTLLFGGILGIFSFAVCAAEPKNFDAEFFDKLSTASLSDIKAILEQGQDVNFANSQGVTPLHYIIMKNRENDLLQAVCDMNANVNAKTVNGDTPLMLAASGNNLGYVKTLLKAGAKVNFTNQKGNTALHLAAGQTRNAMIVKELIKAGADLKAKNAAGMTPLHCGILNRSSRAVAELVQAGEFLRETPDNEGNTPLQLASSGKNMKIARDCDCRRAGKEVDGKVLPLLNPEIPVAEALKNPVTPPAGSNDNNSVPAPAAQTTAENVKPVSEPSQPVADTNTGGQDKPKYNSFDEGKIISKDYRIERINSEHTREITTIVKVKHGREVTFETVKERQFIRCPNPKCDTGYIRKVRHVAGKPDTYVREKCPRCHGKGRIWDTKNYTNQR